jgi:hypothetical protein
MIIEFRIKTKFFERLAVLFERTPWVHFVIGPAMITAILSSVWSLSHDVMVAYGDTESHLNIAKRLIHSLTPGAAQLGGIWLPLPHIMLVPFVYFDVLWRTGLAGAIVSGFFYIVSSCMLYKLTYLLLKNKLAAVVAAMMFIFNPNMMYLQSTAMTELPLIAFFLLTSYFFIKFLKGIEAAPSLILSSMFGFCAVLSRYDGWFLVAAEAGIIVLMGIAKRWKFKKIEGTVIHFATFAFFGIALWLLWDYLILGNPLYFTQSQFSAHAQQEGWYAKGQLPAFKNIPLALAYYFVTSMSNAGILIFFASLLGFFLYVLKKKSVDKLFISMLLLVPFIFYVLTLYLGQSIIFIPHLTPVGFEWRLFNARYGAMMIPVVAFFFAYLFSHVKSVGKLFLVFLCVMQLGLYTIGYSKVISYEDGVAGLSQSKRPDAEKWLHDNYDYGLVLMDDYSRLISVIRSNFPMQNTIYIGNEPYWEQSLVEPERYARWIILQKNDTVWKALYEDPIMQGRLYTFFEKVYTSPEILVFRRRPPQSSATPQ